MKSLPNSAVIIPNRAVKKERGSCSEAKLRQNGAIGRRVRFTYEDNGYDSEEQD